MTTLNETNNHDGCVQRHHHRDHPSRRRRREMGLTSSAVTVQKEEVRARNVEFRRTRTIGGDAVDSSMITSIMAAAMMMIMITTLVSTKGTNSGFGSFSLLTTVEGFSVAPIVTTTPTYDLLTTRRHRQRRQLRPLYSSSNNIPPDDPFVINVDFNDGDDDDENDGSQNNAEGDEQQEGMSIADLVELLQESLANDDENTNSNSMVVDDGQTVIRFIDASQGEEDYDDDDDDDDDDEPESEDPYRSVAPSEFQNSDTVSSGGSSSSMILGNDNGGDDLNTVLDWGGALSKLRERVEDMESGKSQDPSHVLFRQMSSPTPNQLIGQFVSSANPQVVQAMSGAITSLLGGLSNPNMGIETVVKASGEKIGSLCFQLQMTGYMFRNAEYVLALKDLMNLNGRTLTLDDYRAAFDKLDTDKSGYIELSEVQELFSNAYNGEKVPPYEVKAFLQFFDENKDGKISWDEFEKGLGAAIITKNPSKTLTESRLLEGQLTFDDKTDDDDDDDSENDPIDVNTNVSGKIQIELEDGKTVNVDAKEYMENLKEEAKKLKEALRKERGMSSSSDSSSLISPINDPTALIPPNGGGGGMDIATYINSRQGDVKSLTEGINPEIIETMKLLVDFVLEGGDSGKAKTGMSDQEKAEMEMEIPGSALQQLALWQLVLGYRLREAEAKGEYIRLLEG